MKQAVQDVTDFHRVMGQPVLHTPTVPGDDRTELRFDLIEEEFLEVRSALGVNEYGFIKEPVDLVKLADGLADLIYVIVGTALEFGIPLEVVWNEVQRSNMAKAGPDGVVKKRADGKVLKPDDWTPPDIEGVLYGKS